MMERVKISCRHDGGLGESIVKHGGLCLHAQSSIEVGQGMGMLIKCTSVIFPNFHMIFGILVLLIFLMN